MPATLPALDLIAEPGRRRICLSNNAVERALRGIALGRRAHRRG